jgi:tRNA G18 (ribose-2'-O)-methylase SpoU
LPTRALRPSSSQAAPEQFERADDAQRLAKRIETVLARRTSRLIVVLERVVDGHNYSAIFRTCEALGIQHVWVVGPPEERFESRTSLKRRAKTQRAQRYSAAEENRGTNDEPLQAGSRKDRRNQRAADTWAADDALDAEHAAHGRGAARFLSVRDFASAIELVEAVRAVPNCELWCSDLGQEASVLADDAPWVRAEVLPHRVALVFGTESTGVSNELLGACDRRVYVPQHGFADSLNVGVAAALATSHVLKLVGGGGDYLQTTDWMGEAPDVLRERWAGVLCRDAAQLEAVRSADEVPLLDDLRRAPEFRGHTGRPTKTTRRSEFRRRRAEEELS